MAAKGDTPINATGKLTETLWRFINVMSACCLCIGDDRPTSRDLHDHVVNNVANKWRDLGVQLLRPDQENMLDIITADHPHDVVSCCKCVLKKWLDTTSDATWNELIRVLRSPSVELNYFADKLKQKVRFITKCFTKWL